MKKSLLLTILIPLFLIISFTTFSQMTVNYTANCTFYNGTYTENGTVDGKPRYCKDGECVTEPTSYIQWSSANSRWEHWIAAAGAFIAATNSTATATPPCSSFSTWTAVNCSGAVATYAGTSCASSLPIELVSFDGTIANNAINLIWYTETEINNKGFEIEHSVDNRNWETIGIIAGHGTTFEKQNYSFNHNAN